MKTTAFYVTFTEHYFTRAWERLGLSREKAAQLGLRVARNGKTVDSCTGRLRKYLELKQNCINPEHTVLLVHSGNCFVFSDEGVLVTVYSLDKALFKTPRGKVRAPRFSDDDSVVVEPVIFTDSFLRILSLPFGLTYIFAK